MPTENEARALSLRQMAGELLQLADEIAETTCCKSGNRRSRNALSTIEDIEPNLIRLARAEYAARQSRRKFFPKDLLGEPAWDMLLDLFIQTGEQRRVSVTSLCLASQVPGTTALRYVAEMERRGLLIRRKATHDQRVNYLELTDRAYQMMANALGARSDMSAFPHFEAK